MNKKLKEDDNVNINDIKELQTFIIDRKVKFARDRLDSETLKAILEKTNLSFGPQLISYILQYGNLSYKNVEFYGITKSLGINSDMIIRTFNLYKLFPKLKSLILLETLSNKNYILVDKEDNIYEFLVDKNKLKNLNQSLYDYIYIKLTSLNNSLGEAMVKMNKKRKIMKEANTNVIPIEFSAIDIRELDARIALIEQDPSPENVRKINDESINALDKENVQSPKDILAKIKNTKRELNDADSQYRNQPINSEMPQQVNNEAPQAPAAPAPENQSSIAIAANSAKSTVLSMGVSIAIRSFFSSISTGFSAVTKVVKPFLGNVLNDMKELNYSRGLAYGGLISFAIVLVMFLKKPIRRLLGKDKPKETPNPAGGDTTPVLEYALMEQIYFTEILFYRENCTEFLRETNERNMNRPDFIKSNYEEFKNLALSVDDRLAELKNENVSEGRGLFKFTGIKITFYKLVKWLLKIALVSIVMYYAGVYYKGYTGGRSLKTDTLNNINGIANKVMNKTGAILNGSNVKNSSDKFAGKLYKAGKNAKVISNNANNPNNTNPVTNG
jgi:hypothetical protein